MGESDNAQRKAGVPSWQLKPLESALEDKPEAQDTAPQPPPSRATIIENARKFLLEDKVRNAPTDKQVAFLESKGLESHEIRDLLGVARNAEATGSKSEACLSYLNAAIRHTNQICSQTLHKPSMDLQHH